MAPSSPVARRMRLLAREKSSIVSVGASDSKVVASTDNFRFLRPRPASDGFLLAHIALSLAMSGATSEIAGFGAV